MFAGLRCVVRLVVFLNVDFRIAGVLPDASTRAKFSVGATSASSLFIISYYHFRFLMWMQNLGAGNLPKEFFGKLSTIPKCESLYQRLYSKCEVPIFISLRLLIVCSFAASGSLRVFFF